MMGSQNSENFMPDYSTWLTKPQAAEAIGCSTKTVEQLAKEGRIERAYYKRPETGATISVYHPKEVARIRKERNPDAAAFVLPEVSENSESAAVAIRQAVRTDDFLQAIAAIAAGSQNSQNTVRIAEKLYLTLDQAAQLSGLPRSYIRAQMSAGALAAIKTGAGWRIKRADLAAL